MSWWEDLWADYDERHRHDPADVDPALRGPGVTTPWGRAALDGAADDVARAVNGTRNHTLNTAAYKIGQAIGGGHITLDDAVEALTAAGLACGLPRVEVDKCLRLDTTGGLVTGQANPRVPTARPEVTGGRVLTLDDEVVDPATGEVLNGGPEATTTAELTFTNLAELCARVDAAGPRRWLVRGLIPAGTYGVHGAGPKVGKTWNALDLAVSVASGTPWLDTFPIDDPGPVLIAVGEGGEGNVVRRLRAIATARGLTADHLPIKVLTRAPHLTNPVHLAELATELDELRPRLVTLDPLYLSARGADLRDLYGMGAVLEAPQLLCERVGAALLVVHHNNRDKEAKGAARLSGAGPAEWGRFLITGTLVSRRTDPSTTATTTVVGFEVVGGEVPDTEFRLTRTVVAADPADLASPLVYAVRHEDGEDAPAQDATHQGANLHPAARKLLDAARTLARPATIADLVDEVARVHGHGLTRPTCSTRLNELADHGLLDRVEVAPGRPVLWFAATEGVSGVSGDTPPDTSDTPDGDTPSGVSPVPVRDTPR